MKELQLATKSLMKQGLLQFFERGEFALVDGLEALCFWLQFFRADPDPAGQGHLDG